MNGTKAKVVRVTSNVVQGGAEVLSQLASNPEGGGRQGGQQGGAPALEAWASPREVQDPRAID